MYCGYCGAELPNSASFCPHCGKRLVMQDTHTDNLNELVEKARAGNKDAFSDLYEQTYSKVYYTVKSMVKDEDAVFDILQDSYIKAFTHLDSFEGNTQFLPWVKQIATNTARDWLKRQKPLLFSELNHNDESESPVEERFVDDRQTNIPEQVIDQAETKRLIQEIIDELPDDQRAAIGMYYYEEMSVREIAEAMGATENAVKSRLLYGRRKIEKKVRELEKRGTKLYGLAPIPFLLLLFRSQKAYAFEIPDQVLLNSVLKELPSLTGSGTGTVSGAAKAGGGAAARTATAASAGGIAAGKVALIAVTATVVVAAGTFGITRLPDRKDSTQAVLPETISESAESTSSVRSIDETPLSAETFLPEESSENSTVQSEVTNQESSQDVQSEGENQNDDNLPEEDPTMKAYLNIIQQADTYDYQTHGAQPTGSYRYALVPMSEGITIPALLLGQETEDHMEHILIFHYDAAADAALMADKVLVQGVAQTGGYRGSLSVMADGYGIRSAEASVGTGVIEIYRKTLDGNQLITTSVWSGQLGELSPAEYAGEEIVWYDISDLNGIQIQETGIQRARPDTAVNDAVSAFIAQEESAGRIVLTGTIGTYDYDTVVSLQGVPDYNGGAERGSMYRLIVLDEPQTLTLTGIDGSQSGEVRLISIQGAGIPDNYDGQTVVFSIDPSVTYWPSDTSLPVGQPGTSDVHIMELKNTGGT